MENKRRLTNKYILLAMLLIAVFVLPSCRTRISNNSEITTVQYDESGFMSEDYQMRRDELGLSTAEKPLLPNFGSGESDDSDDFEEGEYIDYNPEDYQEDFTETETNTNNNNNNRNNSNTGTRNRSTTPSRGSSRGTTTTKKYTVTFKGNGGTPDKQTKEFKRHSKISFPTDPERKGYDFTGWYTEADNDKGSKVDTSVTVSSDRTLYAHWKKKETPKPKPDPKPTEYTVRFTDGIGNTISEQKVKEGKGAVEPKKPSRDGYTFAGWDTSFDKITADIDINAKWDPKKNDPAYWADVTDKEVRDITSQPLCFVDGGESGIVQSCSAKATRKEEDYGSAEYVIAYASDDEEAETLKTKHEGKSLLIISNDATKNDREYTAVYRIIILNWLHGSSLSYQEAANELKVDYKIYYPEEDS
ncbi:MAG: InlB B-repeat-containing protein [Mogibacterium sp.]|nr:InlB B-repeat-containing protein [Mogibacterium sp.]